MTYDEAYNLITWCVVLIVGLPIAWVVWDWWRSPRR